MSPLRLNHRRDVSLAEVSRSVHRARAFYSLVLALLLVCSSFIGIWALVETYHGVKVLTSNASNGGVSNGK